MRYCIKKTLDESINHKFYECAQKPLNIYSSEFIIWVGCNIFNKLPQTAIT